MLWFTKIANRNVFFPWLVKILMVDMKVSLIVFKPLKYFSKGWRRFRFKMITMFRNPTIAKIDTTRHIHTYIYIYIKLLISLFIELIFLCCILTLSENTWKIPLIDLSGTGYFSKMLNPSPVMYTASSITSRPLLPVYGAHAKSISCQSSILRNSHPLFPEYLYISAVSLYFSLEQSSHSTPSSVR